MQADLARKLLLLRRSFHRTHTMRTLFGVAPASPTKLAVDNEQTSAIVLVSILWLVCCTAMQKRTPAATLNQKSRYQSWQR